MARVTKFLKPFLNYSEENILSGFTSNTKDDITVSATHDSSNAYKACDDDEGTIWAAAGHQTWCGNPYPFIPGSGGTVDFFISFGTPLSLWKMQMYQATGWSGVGTFNISEDNGSTWIEIGALPLANGEYGTLEFTDYIDYEVNLVKLHFTGMPYAVSSPVDCVTQGMDTYTIKLFKVINGYG